MPIRTIIHIEMYHRNGSSTETPGQIVLARKNQCHHLVLASDTDRGVQLLERAFENDRIFRNELKIRRDFLCAKLDERRSLAALAPTLEEIGALPITIYQLETILREEQEES